MHAIKTAAGDFLSTIAFFTLYLSTDNLIAAIIGAMVVALLQILYSFFRQSPQHYLQWCSHGFVTMFGIISAITNDPVYIMLKPSLVHFILGMIMIRGDWLMRYTTPTRVQDLGEATIIAWGRAWGVLQFFIAIANLLAALTLAVAQWGLVITVLNLIAIPFAAIQKMVLKRIKKPNPAL